MLNQLFAGLTQSRLSPKTFAIDYIELNYREIQCLEMALYFLQSQLLATRPHKPFHCLCKHHTDHLNNWLHDNSWRSQLCFDGKNSVQCPVEGLEDAKWFALACELGVTENTASSMAFDEANYKLDMIKVYGEDLQRDFVEDEIFNHYYDEFHSHYAEIANHRHQLAKKFRQILNY